LRTRRAVERGADAPSGDPAQAPDANRDVAPIVPLDTLSPARRSLLTAIKRLGETSAEKLAEILSITPSAVRQQLASAADEGLVIHREIREGRGRPRHLYTLSHAGHRLFPAGYGALARDVLDYVAEMDPALVDGAFERRRRQRVERGQARLAGLPFSRKVWELARILDEDGYLAEALPQPDGSWRIVEHNCAIFAVARRYGQACSTEIAFLREVLPEAEVERVSHMVAGGKMCAYEIRRRGGGRRALKR
jgi:DeoR family suf operon transcriptional repressor